MTHKHDHCDHQLRYCTRCDVVYCLKCDREWGGHTHWSYPYHWYIGDPIPCITTTVWDGTGNDIDVSTSDAHISNHVQCV